MNLRMIGCNFRASPVEIRERLAFPEDRIDRALDELVARYDCEAVILNTCNRVELYLARPVVAQSLDADLLAEFLSEFHQYPVAAFRPHLVELADADAVRHLFRVAASLDSMIVGEGQIAGQVKRAYERAQARLASGPLLHAAFQHAFAAAKRVRSETGIARGHVSVSSVAVDYVKEVFTRFDDKTILVIGAGKMGGLTLRHLKALRPRQILVTNRSPDKAEAMAAECAGTAILWAKLDQALAQADIILSTTGATEPIVTLYRWNSVLAQRSSGTAVILDIAVPRDFDPRIHDGDRTCLFNIDDLKRIQQQTLADRRAHIGPAEAIVEQEQAKFLKDWTRRRNGPIIARLTQDVDQKRREVVRQLLDKLNGRLTEEDKRYLEKAFHLFQSRILHGPITALDEAAHEGQGHTLLEALRKLFRLQESKEE
ncbi:MAG TPA: glutamyl-tRNA reductase [Gemmataceae bacterium]|nr:glutamyl-tRNA reductase [Gemmataceae bacterium]